IDSRIRRSRPRCCDTALRAVQELRTDFTVSMSRRRVIQGWKCIVDHVGMSEPTARKFSKRATDPLPVYRVGGRFYAYEDELDAWCERTQEKARHTERLSYRVLKAILAL